MKPFKVRAHHGMCLAFFIGKGYNNSFVDNMQSRKEYLETENPMIEVICGADHICDGCPHNLKGICASIGKVHQYDQKVLSACGIQEHSILSWNEFSKIVEEKVIQSGIRKTICTDCEWNSICETLEKERY